jgi:dTDP-4-amino-4,6-dideoxygalactose transaminase
MFDAAHAFGCGHNGSMIGNFGELEVFSFHATKILNTFEGGAIVTNSSELAEKIRFMRNFGFSDTDQVDFIGTNGKMSEMSAAMGLAGMECFGQTVTGNKCNYESYMHGLADISGVSLAQYNDKEHCNYHYIVAEVDEDKAGVSRDMLVDILQRENIMARRYFYPGCHRMEPYRSYFPNAGLLLPNTEKLADSVLCLPNGSAIDNDTVRKICGLVGFIVNNSKQIRNKIGQ